MTADSDSESSELLDMSKSEVSEEFENAQEFADALADAHVSELSHMSVDTSGKRERLSNLFLDMIKEDEIWE